MGTFDVLITCPPMIGMLPDLDTELSARGLRAAAPRVVQVMSEEELVDILPGYDGWILGDDPATARVFEAGRGGRLRAAVKWGVGVDNVDFEAAKRLALPIAHTPGMFGDEVADIAVGYVIGLARETFWIDREVRRGGWPKPRGMSLRGKHVALVGFGNIGRRIAQRLLAAKMHVTAYDPAFQPLPELDAVVHRVWPDGIEAADVLVLACALTRENVQMINQAVLERVKPGLRLVNVSRGKLIDENALVAGLAGGQVHSAALDVFETEPLPSESPLRNCESCIFGSHNGSNTTEAVLETSVRAADLLCEFLREPSP